VAQERRFGLPLTVNEAHIDAGPVNLKGAKSLPRLSDQQTEMNERYSELVTDGLTLCYLLSEPGLEVRASPGHESATWGTRAGHDEAPVRLIAFDCADRLLSSVPKAPHTHCAVGTLLDSQGFQ
jgi:hypothetical protein